MNTEVRSARDRAAILPILRRRQAVLVEMLENEPGQVRALMLDASETRRILAAAPEAAELLESEGTWDGELETSVQDDFGARASVTRFYLRTRAGERLRVVNDPGVPLARDFCPQPVRIAGLKIGPVLESTSAEVLSVEAATTCSPLGEQKVATFLLSYPSTPLNNDWTSENANSIVSGATGSIASYVNEVSHGKAFLSGQVFGPYVLDTNFECFESPDIIAAALIRRVGASVNFRAFQRLILIVPPAPDCGGGSRGVSTVGCWTISLAPGQGTTQLSILQVSNSFGVPYNSGSSRFVLTHEFGHSLGLSHASSIAFSGAPLGGPSATGTRDEYGDGFSVMGDLQTGHFGAPHQDLLGWLDPGGVTTVSTSGAYQLRPLESAAAQTPKALKILRPVSGTARYLWIEYRQPIGMDAALSSWSSTAFSGVIVHYQDPPLQEGADKTHLLDYHPLTFANFRDSPLRSGETWSDPSSTLRLTIGTATPSGIDVTVSLGTECSYSLGPGSGANVPAEGGGGSITVTTPAGCAWSSSSNSGWLSITSGFSGSGFGVVQFSAAANTGAQRSGNITIAGQTYTVAQAAFVPTCSYIIGPGSETNVPASGGSGSINVTTSAGCAWSATTSSDWLAIVGGSTGSGSGTVQFAAAANTGAQRSGAIAVAGLTYTVHQAAGTCTYSLSPGSGADVPASGGSGSLTVTTAAGCAWAAGSTTNWLVVTNGFSGSGPGIVQYSVLANSGTQRIAAISIADKIYTVTQASGTVSLTPDNSLTLSQFAGGGPNWHTTLFLTNLSNTAENFILRFYDDAGLAKPMPIATLGTVDTITGTIAPGQTIRYETGAGPTLEVSWALLTPATPATARLSGLAVFRQTVPSGTSTVSSEGVVEFTPVTESKYVLLYDNLGGPLTTAAFVNPDALSSLTILADIRDENGALLATDSITLQPLGHTAFELMQRFPITINRRGSIRFDSSPRGFTGLGVRFSPFGTFTSFRLLTSPDIQ